MQTTEKPKRKVDLGKALSTRNGTLAVSAIAALLAGGLLLVFLNRTARAPAMTTATVNVLVAKRLIERGSAADVLADQGVFQHRARSEGRAQAGRDRRSVDPRGNDRGRRRLPG